MKKVLLVIENYQEAQFLRGFLSKFGWDIDIIQNDSLLQNKISEFYPNIIIANYNGVKIKSEKWDKDVVEKAVLVAVVDDVLQYAEFKQKNYSQFIEVLSKPFVEKDILTTIGELSGRNIVELMDKYDSFVSNSIKDDTGSSLEKNINYIQSNESYEIKLSKLLDENDINFDEMVSLDKGVLRGAKQQHRLGYKSVDKAVLKKVDAGRSEFVKKLISEEFKKK